MIRETAKGIHEEASMICEAAKGIHEEVSAIFRANGLTIKNAAYHEHDTLH